MLSAHLYLGNLCRGHARPSFVTCVWVCPHSKDISRPCRQAVLAQCSDCAVLPVRERGATDFSCRGAWISCLSLEMTYCFIMSDIAIEFAKLVSRRPQEQLKQYKVLRKLGEGCSGDVFQVLHQSLDIKRALKIITKSKGLSINEVQILKQLDHPNILKVFEYFQDQTRIYVVTEIFEGKQLFEQIVSNAELDLCITEADTALIIKQVLSALVYAHSKNYVHRDVKPQNILVRKSKGSFQVKLIDWGLVVFKQNQFLQTKCGTPEYCAPQVLSRKYTQKCDVWSAGVVLYTTLSGGLPFKGTTTQQTIKKVIRGAFRFNSEPWDKISAECKQLIAGMLQKDIKSRLSALEALQHPWIKKMTEHVTPNKEFSKISLNKLSSFNVMNRFQMSALAYISRHLHSMEQQKQLGLLFHSLDTNNDGVISMEQLLKGFTLYQQTLSEDQIKSLFSKLDIDKSGGISYNQFICALVASNSKFSQEQMRCAFKLFDVNGDGDIEVKEIIDLLGKDNPEEWSKQIQEFDSDKNGKISFQEFCKMLKEIGKKPRQVKRRNSLPPLAAGEQVERLTRSGVRRK